MNFFSDIVVYYNSLTALLQAWVLTFLILTAILIIQIIYRYKPPAIFQVFFRKHVNKFYLAAVISFFFRAFIALGIRLINLIFDAKIELIPGTYFILYLFVLLTVVCFFNRIYSSFIKFVFNTFVIGFFEKQSLSRMLFRKCVEKWDKVVHFYLYSHHNTGRTFFDRLNWFVLSYMALCGIVIFPPLYEYYRGCRSWDVFDGTLLYGYLCVLLV